MASVKCAAMLPTGIVGIETIKTLSSTNSAVQTGLLSRIEH